MSSTPDAPQKKKDQVEYRRLGKSGLRVSVPILGAMSFGSDKWLPWVINEDKVRLDLFSETSVGIGVDVGRQALELLKAAWDHGVTTWDTANTYSNGESEKIIGKALNQVSTPSARTMREELNFRLYSSTSRASALSS